jgi:hypothetical protein
MKIGFPKWGPRIQDPPIPSFVADDGMEYEARVLGKRSAHRANPE